MKKVLNVSDLNAYYGESIILRNINFTIKPGQVVGIVGRNGVGKTTFLKSIMGLVNTPSGRIDFYKEDIVKLPTYNRARRGIAYVPQGRDIFPQLTVYENLVMGLNTDTDEKIVENEIFELFPVLKTMLNRKGGDLSGGQQQQLAIARALVSKPQLLILDEPTEGIQPSIIKEIGYVLKSLKDIGELSILLIEQYLDFVIDLADHVYVMEKGELEYYGDINTINFEKLKLQVSI